MSRSRAFKFDGGAGTYLGTALLGLLITVVSLGICYPFALVLRQRWRAKHTYINGHRLVFTGSTVGLFGSWIKWLGLSVITAGIYLLWVGPRLQKWVVENTDFDPTWTPGPAFASSSKNEVAPATPPHPPIANPIAQGLPALPPPPPPATM